ncbi:MAG: ATP-binding protein [Clostridia bacterium]|jgi:serine/threonine-protein kinase RsbW
MDFDVITLKLPAKPEYVLAIRLTTSALASRAGFDVDAIEDIKVAVAEGCIAMMNQQRPAGSFDIKYKLHRGLSIQIVGEGEKSADTTLQEANGEKEDQDDLSLFIIESLMDSASFQKEKGRILRIDMIKKTNE